MSTYSQCGGEPGRLPQEKTMEIVSPDNSEHYFWGDKCDGWHLVKTASLSVIQERVPGGCGEVRHLHQKSEQFFYVLSGVATLEVHEQNYRLEPGYGMHVPAGVTHQLRNESSRDLVFIVTSTPPSHGDRTEKDPAGMGAPAGSRV